MDDHLEGKVVVLGCTNVGKTSITMRYCHDTYTTPTCATIGASFLQKRINLPNQNGDQNQNGKKRKITLSIWDTAGQERFRSMAPMYYRNAKAAILVFDNTQKETLFALREWLASVQDHVEEDVVLVLVGNKCDSEDGMDSTIPIAFADEIGAVLFFTSAKDGTGIDEVFTHVAEKLYSQATLKEEDTDTIALHSSKRNMRNYCC